MKHLRKIIAMLMCTCMILCTYNINVSAMDLEENEYSDSETVATDTDADVVTDFELGYVVVGSEMVSTSEEQYVLVGFLNMPEGEISDATLKIHNTDKTVEYVETVDVISGDALLFQFACDDTMSGNQEVVSVDIYVDGNLYTVPIKDAGVTANFGVNIQVETEPDAWIYDTDVTVDVQTMDGVMVTDAVNTSITADDVAQAIAEVAPNGNAKAGTDGKFIVVLDPGHGNDGDPGAVKTWNGVTYVERDINLKIAQYCKAALEGQPGITVYMTRETNDSGMRLAAADGEEIGEIVSYADSVNADILVSIHNNSSGNSSVNGSEVYYPNGNYDSYLNELGQSLSEQVLSKLKELGLNARGTYIRNSANNTLYPDGSLADYYGIIRQSKLCGFPGIIIEHAYLSNQSDAEKYLGSDEALKRLGEADAAAIIAYYKECGETIKSDTVYNGVDYSAVYNFEHYMAFNGDLQAAYGNNTKLALRHFVQFGMKEGRQASTEFNVYTYMENYPDLKSGFGSDLAQYYMHYVNYGKAEGRVAGQIPTVEDKEEVEDTTDYSAVYNFDYYMAKYGDLRNAYANDPEAAKEHFIKHGMEEGRQGSAEFEVYSYQYRYPDLKAGFGDDLKLYYLHYINNGKAEGRVGKAMKIPTETPSVPEEPEASDTVYNGVDYSAVYNFDYYMAKYGDLRNAYANDPEAAIEHFVKHGMSEGRQGSSEFEVYSYRYRYPDLKAGFGNDLKLYFMHYINNGKEEGRVGTATKIPEEDVVEPEAPSEPETPSEPSKYVTEYNGVDYSNVYSFEYYTVRYGDISAAFGNNPEAALNHFVNFGMNEGRQGSEEFNVDAYKNNYPDLAKGYGNNTKEYYMHYIFFGKKEGRIANVMILHDIMGSNTTNVSQMVAYYNANATYPSYYAGSDAPTIEAFCQIYLEECAAEGVNAEIAFCQSMKETGFLRYGGQVDISQYNFAGIGAVDGGAKGATFASVREGVRAHVQHLKAYASSAPLNNPCVDPRFSLVTRNTAPYVEWLGISENPYGKGWATASRYGYSILNDYVAKLKTY